MTALCRHLPRAVRTLQPALGFQGKFTNICPEMFVLRADSIASVIVQRGVQSRIFLPTLLPKHKPCSPFLPLSALSLVCLAAGHRGLKIACSYSACYWISWQNDHEQFPCQCICLGSGLDPGESSTVCWLLEQLPNTASEADLHLLILLATPVPL